MKNKILDQVKQAVLKLEPTAEVILYGSRARKDYNKNSDWDFLILVDGLVDTTRTDRIRCALYDIELNTNMIISSIVRSKKVWNSRKYAVIPLKINVEREGIRI